MRNAALGWGLRGQSPRNVLVITHEPEQLSELCEFATVLEVTASPHAMPEENGKAVAYCRGLRRPLAELWPEILHFG